MRRDYSSATVQQNDEWRFFETWFEEQLLPETPQDVAIILDSASFHRKNKLFDIAGKYNKKVILLPPYSPDLNPIEHFWHWLKKIVTDTLRFTPDLASAICTAF